MLAKLLEHGAAPGQEREIAITKEEFLIGRGDDCDLRLQVPAISRHHCLVRVRPSETTLTDLGSANGTFVNDQRIRSQTTLAPGDEIRVGDFRFMLVLDGPSGVNWAKQEGAAPASATVRLQRSPAVPDGLPKKEESHPPGEAGG